jgi:hypothetical protein
MIFPLGDNKVSPMHSGCQPFSETKHRGRSLIGAVFCRHSLAHLLKAWIRNCGIKKQSNEGLCRLRPQSDLLQLKENEKCQ